MQSQTTRLGIAFRVGTRHDGSSATAGAAASALGMACRAPTADAATAYPTWFPDRALAFHRRAIAADPRAHPHQQGDGQEEKCLLHASPVLPPRSPTSLFRNRDRRGDDRSSQF